MTALPPRVLSSLYKYKCISHPSMFAFMKQTLNCLTLKLNNDHANVRGDQKVSGMEMSIPFPLLTFHKQYLTETAVKNTCTMHILQTWLRAGT